MSCLLDRLKVKRLRGSFNGEKCTYKSLSSSLQEIHFIWNKHIQIEHNRIKQPNWQEATNWLFISVKARQPRTNPVPNQDLNLGMSDCESEALIPQPCCLPTFKTAEWPSSMHRIATLGVQVQVLLWPLLVWFCNRTGTSVGDGTHKLNNGLTNGRMANWAPEVVFSPFRAFCRCQLMFPSCC